MLVSINNTKSPLIRGFCIIDEFNCRLGNVRLVHDDSEQAKIYQGNYYSAFGVSILSLGDNMTPTQTVLSNDRLYNGKELQDGTNWLDYGARMYYPELGRWMAVDPLPDTGGQESWSTYQYVFNNPAKLTDPDGRFPFPLIALLPEIGDAATAVAEYAVGSVVGVAVGTGLHKLAHSGILAGGGNSVVPYSAQLLTKKFEKEQSSGHSTSKKNESRTNDKNNGANSSTNQSKYSKLDDIPKPGKGKGSVDPLLVLASKPVLANSQESNP